jgi:hypothetical protein
VILPAPTFGHLRRLTDHGGVYEHACLTVPRPEHGYCVDDVARALVVVCREAAHSSAQDDLLEQYLAFVLAAQAADGRFHNRRGTDLVWSDEPSVEDCWGRALWGLGATVSSRAEPRSRDAALAAFERGAVWPSPWARATAFAALGALEVLRVEPSHRVATELVVAAVGKIGRPSASAEWPWPEPRLRYANAVLPEVLLGAGEVLGSPALVADGLLLLDWLLALQTRDSHLSVVPVRGLGPDDGLPAFDQQPIEVAALADACAKAHEVTHDPRWLHGVELAASWFLGDNDSGTALYDETSGGGCDGLERDGRNENQGAESTLAVLSTLQQARRLALCAP